jgi:hypothetical protein
MFDSTIDISVKIIIALNLHNQADVAAYFLAAECWLDC